MPRGLIYASRALADIDAMRRWQTQPGSGLAAIRRVKPIQAAIRRLNLHSCRYPVDRYPDMREQPCDGGYRAQYRVIPDTDRDQTAGDVRVL